MTARNAAAEAARRDLDFALSDLVSHLPATNNDVKRKAVISAIDKLMTARVQRMLDLLTEPAPATTEPTP